MRSLKNTLLIVGLLLCVISSSGQTGQDQKTAVKEMAIKQAVENKSFVFTPDYARADRGKEILIDYIYKDRSLIFKDGVITSYLPHVSTGQLVTFQTTSKINDIQFESHKYELTTTEKKGKYTMVFKLLDCPDIREVIIDITPNGNYSSVRLMYYRYEPTNLTGKLRPINSNQNDTSSD